MKILVLSNCPLDAAQGSGYVTLGFCQGLRARGHEVDLFGPQSFEPLPALQGRARSYRQALGIWRFCQRQLRRKKYDVVELWGGEAWLAISLLSRRARRPLLVSHSNGLETHFAQIERQSPAAGARRWYQLDQSRLMERAFTLSDGLVTVSHFDADYARQHRYQEPERIVTIENSLAPEFLDLPVEWERERVVGFCGSWLENKGASLMREAMRRVLSLSPATRLRLVGVGEAFDKQQQFPEVCAQVDVVPFVREKTELRRLYREMAVLLSPSIYESFGLARAEAMACGCALVATRTGLAASLVDGQQARLLPEHSALALQHAVQELLGDETLRRHIARGGYERVQSLRWPDAVETLEATYQAWLAERGATPSKT